MAKKQPTLIMVNPDLSPEVAKIVKRAVEKHTVPPYGIVDSSTLPIGWSLGVGGAVIHDFAYFGAYLVGGMTAAVAIRAALPNRVKEIRNNAQARKAYRSQDYRLSDLGWDEGEKMIRSAFESVAYITRSTVHIEDRIDSARNNLVLPRQLWDLMGDLAELQEHRKDTPKQDALAAAHRGVIQQITVNCERRVQALETYATQVISADKRLAELKAVEKLESRSSGLMDLLARTSTVDIAVAELNELTGHAATLVESYRTALAAAREAGLALESA
jgi:hypothetical protein